MLLFPFMNNKCYNLVIFIWLWFWIVYLNNGQDFLFIVLLGMTGTSFFFFFSAMERMAWMHTLSNTQTEILSLLSMHWVSVWVSCVYSNVGLLVFFWTCVFTDMVQMVCNVDSGCFNLQPTPSHVAHVLLRKCCRWKNFKMCFLSDLSMLMSTEHEGKTARGGSVCVQSEVGKNKSSLSVNKVENEVESKYWKEKQPKNRAVQVFLH